MHRWMSLSRISTREARRFEKNLKFLKLDEEVVRSQPLVDGQKLADVVALAFHGNEEYAGKFIRCISKWFSANIPRLPVGDDLAPKRFTFLCLTFKRLTDLF